MGSEDLNTPIMDPMRRTGLADEIAARIQSYVARSGFKPGDRLPTTARLAEMLGVGVPTLREAINQLKAIGVLDVRHGSGVYVGQAVDQLFKPVQHYTSRMSLCFPVLACSCKMSRVATMSCSMT